MFLAIAFRFFMLYLCIVIGKQRRFSEAKNLKNIFTK
jgi:hypothetical protein